MMEMMSRYWQLMSSIRDFGDSDMDIEENDDDFDYDSEDYEYLQSE